MIVAFLFVSFAVFSGLVFPFLFAGTPIARVSTTEPLAWGLPNFAQLCYLLAASGVYLIAISSSRSELEETLEWYVKGCVLSAIIALYQLLSVVTHLPFPSGVLYSNKSYVIFPAYQINGLWRINSTFTEASDMAGFMIVGIALLGWTIVTRLLRFWRACAFALLLFSLLLTESTAGYATLILLVGTGGVIFVGSLIARGTLDRGKLVVCLTMIAILGGIFYFGESAPNAVHRALETTFFQKQNSDSFRARNLTHVIALQALADTDYLGAGWGSVRASGLFYCLLANTGVLGVTLFLLFVGSLFLPLFQRAKRGFMALSNFGSDTYTDSPLPRALFAMIMLLTTMAIAGSEIGNPILWVLFGVATLGGASHSVTETPAITRSQNASFDMQRNRTY